jgi:putative transposase
MARPWRVVYSGAKYHVTSRGNGRQRIFLDDSDYERFLVQLEHCLEEDEVILYAFCLMPNHYHLFVETPLGNIKKFMQRLNTAYSMYYRYKHNRPGHCLQGRYGAKLIDGDDYIMALTRYVHLNPIKTTEFEAKTLAFKRRYLKGYKWSSYRGYIDESGTLEIMDYRWLDLTGRKTTAGKRNAYERYIAEYISKDDKEFGKALTASRYAIGDEKFTEEAEDDITSQMERKVVYGDVMEPWKKKGLKLPEIMEIVCSVYGVTERALRAHGLCTGIAKIALVELCCKYSSQTQRAVAQYLGYKSESTVGKHRQRLKVMLLDNKKELKRFNAAVKEIGKGGKC